MAKEGSVDTRQIELNTGSPGNDGVKVEEERVYLASQWRLMWWRFRKHRLALVSAVVVALFYLVALFPEFCDHFPIEAELCALAGNSMSEQ